MDREPVQERGPIGTGASVGCKRRAESQSSQDWPPGAPVVAQGGCDATQG